MKRRKPVIAFLLSILVVGLGQLYNGQWKKGVLYQIAYALIPLVLLTLDFGNTLIGLVVILSLVLVLIIVPLIDATITANRLKEYEKKWFNNPLLYLVIIISAFTINYFTYDIWNFKYQRFNAVSPSMYPTFVVGDSFIANMSYYKDKKPNLGEVVLYKAQYDPNIVNIGRIAGMSGDKIALSDFKLLINSELTESTFIGPGDLAYDEYPTEIFKSTLGSIQFTYSTFDYQPVFGGGISSDFEADSLVAPNHYFILCDARSDALDSREYGTVHKDDIVGKPLYFVWSNEKDKIGKQVQ